MIDQTDSRQFRTMPDLATEPTVEQFARLGWQQSLKDVQVPSAAADIEPDDIGFKNMMLPGEDYLKGIDRLNRHLRDGNLCLNVFHFFRFWEMRNRLPDEWQKTSGGEARCILFDSTKFRDAENETIVLFMFCYGGIWKWNHHWIDEELESYYESGIAGR